MQKVKVGCVAGSYCSAATGYVGATCDSQDFDGHGSLRSIRLMGRLIDWFNRFDRFHIRTARNFGDARFGSFATFRFSTPKHFLR